MYTVGKAHKYRSDLLTTADIVLRQRPVDDIRPCRVAMADLALEKFDVRTDGTSLPGIEWVGFFVVTQRQSFRLRCVRSCDGIRSPLGWEGARELEHAHKSNSSKGEMHIDDCLKSLKNW